MPPISVSDGVTLVELERCWHRANKRSERAAKAYFVAATSFLVLVGFVKFGYLAPIEKAPVYEIVIWLASAFLVLSLLSCLFICLWKEWRTYESLALFTGHPGAIDGAPLKVRLPLFLEFVRAGQS